MNNVTNCHKNIKYTNWKINLTKTASTKEGLYVIYYIMLNLHYFSQVFTICKAIYKNAALIDVAKWIEQELDEINTNYIITIKELHKYQQKLNKQNYTTNLKDYISNDNYKYWKASLEKTVSSEEGLYFLYYIILN